MKVKKSPAALKPGIAKTKLPYNNSSASQRARILARLITHGSITTTEARNEFGIMGPAPRIFELRKLNYDIRTIRIYEIDSNGVSHRMGKYVYCGKKNDTSKGGQ